MTFSMETCGRECRRGKPAWARTLDAGKRRDKEFTRRPQDFAPKAGFSRPESVIAPAAGRMAGYGSGKVAEKNWKFGTATY
jgi:hypothetical protein